MVSSKFNRSRQTRQKKERILAGILPKVRKQLPTITTAMAILRLVIDLVKLIRSAW